MAKNKVIYGGEVLIDLTADTVTADKILSGYTAHDKHGEVITGTSTFDADTSSATAQVSEVLAGKTYFGQGAEKTGTMPNNGAVAGKISTKAGTYKIPIGFHDGSGTAAIDSTEQAKIIPGNIKNGITILGVQGTYGGEAVKAQSKSVTPTTSKQTVLPDATFDYLTQVEVAAIPYTETPNSYGTTVTIG